MMTTKGMYRTIIIVSIILLNLGCDQFSKKMIRENLHYDQTIRMLNDHLTVTKVENTGAFLSLGDSLPKPVKDILLSLLPLFALLFGFFYAITRHTIPPPILLGLCFVIGGGVGNIFDRINYGSVTDFLHIRLGSFQTGIFNLADVSIMIGMCLIAVQFLVRKKNLQ